MAERFFLPHNPVKGRQGGQSSGFLVSQSWSPLGPVRMFPPPAAGGVQLGLQGGLEGGSLCPACGADSQQLTGGGARLGVGAQCGYPLDAGDRLAFQTRTGGISRESQGLIRSGEGHVRARGCQCSSSGPRLYRSWGGFPWQ